MRAIVFVTAGSLIASALFVATAYAGPCLTGHANTKVTVGANFAGENKESGTVYEEGDCASFVAEISISSVATQLPPATISDTWGPAIVISAGDANVQADSGTGGRQTDWKKDVCLTYKEKVELYKKSGSDYKLVSEYARHGVWHPGFVSGGNKIPDWCSVDVSSGVGNFQAVNPPKSGTDEYRVVESSSVSGKPRRVHVSVSHQGFSTIH